MKVAAIIVGLAVAGLPALASTVPAYAKAHKPAATKAEAKSTRQRQTSGQQPCAGRRHGSLCGHAGSRPIGHPGGPRLVDAYEGGAGGDFDDKTVSAVKTFQSRNSGKPTGDLTAAERDPRDRGEFAARTMSAGGFEDSVTGARLGLPTNSCRAPALPVSAAA